MDFVYVLISNFSGSDWEDMVILLLEEDAINASKENPNTRVEIFSKNNKLGYTPTYKYYKQGKLYSENIPSNK